MAEELREEKRPAVKARKAGTQQAQKMTKGARRKQRSGTGPRSSDRAYGTRNVGKLHQGPAISITVQLPRGLQRRKAAASKKSIPPAKNLTQGSPRNTRQMSRRLWPVLTVPVIALVGAFIYFYPFKGGANKPVETAAAAARTAPSYQPLVPSAEKATASTYDTKRNLVSYNVTFSGARLTVSQQELPVSIKKDPASIMKAADSIKATQQVETNKGLLYVATNEESGGQLALIAGKTVLVFVSTDKKLDNATWMSFINLLESKSWESVKS